MIKNLFKFVIWFTFLPLALASCSNSNSGTADNPPATKETYTITWKNYDGSVLETDTNVEEGSIPHYDGATPTRSGDAQYSYIFSGWSPSITTVTGDATYTAQFTSSTNTYTITWENYDGAVLETDINVAYGASPSYDGITPTRSGDAQYSYTFSGWSPSITTVTGDATYTALYSQTKIGVKLTITYSLYNPKTNQLIQSYTSKPSDIGNVSVSQAYNFNTNVDLFAEPNEGYTFVGWYYDDLILSSEPNYKYMMWDDDVTLEARFQYTTYSLHVFANHSENGLVMIKNGNYSTYVSEDTTSQYYTESITIAAYTKNDTRFLGWYDENNQLISTNAVYTFDMDNSNRNIEAKWNYFTISYDLGGGTNNDSNPTTYNVDSGNIVLASPIKNGYTFIGWKYNDEFTEYVYQSWNKDVTLVAIWEVNTYSITYNLSGGLNNDANPSTYNVDSDTIVLLSPSRTGYTFIGWYKDSSFATQITEISSGSYGDLCLFAKWSADRQELRVTSEDETYGSVYITSGSGYTDELVTIHSEPKTGCGFKCWLSEGKVLSYDETYTFTMPAHTLIIVAKFYGPEEFENLSKLVFEINADGASYAVSAINTNLSNSVYIPDYHEGLPVTEVKENGFSYTSIKNIRLPNYLQKIRKKSFYNCELIEEITFPNTLTEIDEEAFESCDKITEFNIPKSVKIIGERAFHSCASLTSIIVDSENENYASIDGILYDKEVKNLIKCPDNRIKDVSLPSTVENILYCAFNNCKNIKSIVLNEGLKTIGDSAFYHCASLKEINLPNTLTAIMGYAFEYCESIESIFIPDSVTTLSACFEKCYSLKSVYIGNGIEIINNSTFANCTNLESVTISNSVKIIGSGVFYNCSLLSAVSYLGTIEEWNSIQLYDSWLTNSVVTTIHCSDGEISL